MSDIERYSTSNTQATMKWSEAMSNGDLLPPQYRGKPANLMFAAEYADSLGISRIHVLTSIAVINGRPSPSADLMAAMVRAHGHKLRIYGDDTQATAELVRADDPDFTFSATWDQAKATKARLWGNKGPWSQYPAAMLRARAISEVVRMGAQDVMAGGIYTPEELGAVVDADGTPTGSQPQQQATRTSTVPARSPRDAAMQALNTTPQAKRTLDDEQVAATLEWVEGATDVAKLRAKHDGAAALVDDQREWIQQLINARIDELTGDDSAAEVSPEVDAEVEPDTAA